MTPSPRTPKKPIGKTLLITGGTGFIGSHTVVALIEAGYRPIIVDNLSRSDVSVLDGIEEITGYRPHLHVADLRDREELRKVFVEHPIEAVIHFAGFKLVGESTAYPLRFHDNNIIGSIQLFELMEEYGVRDILFSSSSSVYRHDAPLPLREDTPISAEYHPYGTTKIIIEQMLHDLAIHRDWRVGILRYFNPVGAHETGAIGENIFIGEGSLFARVMRVAIGSVSGINIYGNDYDTPDGTCVRDYIHVMDLAEGHISALRHMEKLPTATGYYDIYNLGTGKGTTVLKLIKATAEITGRPIPYTVGPRRTGDISVGYCAVDRARDMLGWQARRDVRDAIKNEWTYVQRVGENG